MRRRRMTSRSSTTDPPGAVPRLARFQHHEIAAGAERVRRAGHRLHRHRAPLPVTGQRVAGEHLPPTEGLVGPDPYALSIHCGQFDHGTAIAVMDHVAEGGVEYGRADPPGSGEVELAAGDAGRAD